MARVCHVNLARGFRGGERQTALLIGELAIRQVEQVLVCRPDSPMIDQVTGRPGLSVSPVRSRLAGHWRRPSMEIVHAHESKAAHWALVQHLTRGTPYIISRRNVFVPKKVFFTRSTYGRASRIVAVSDSVARVIEAYDGSLPIDVVRDASGGFKSEPTAVARLKSEYRGRRAVGHVGALDDGHKGQMTLLEVARRWRDEHPEIVFVFAGSGPDEERFKSQSADLDNVIWLGFRDDVADVIASFDVFAFPSRFEALGSTLIDAMAMNVPIVASNVDGIPELVRNEGTGLLVDASDPRAWEDAIMQLLSDRSLAARLVANAASFAENLTPAKMADRYLEIYEAALRDRAA